MPRTKEKYQGGASKIHVLIPDVYREVLSKEAHAKSVEEGRRVSFADLILQALWEKYPELLPHPQSLLRETNKSKADERRATKARKRAMRP